MGSRTFLNRMRKELADLERDPPPLITCYPSDDDITQLEAYLNGPPNTPYEKGIFRLDINMPESYPFDPPMIRFRTPIYHPNIDECGRICASILKKGKDDQWKPSMNLRTTLLSLHSLIGEPNPDDPLDADIAREYQQDYDLFVNKAKEHTKKHAVDMPENLIPNTYTASTTHMTTNTDMDLNNHVSTVAVEDTTISTGNKHKSKSKLSLSKKKQPGTQSATTLSSSSSYDIVESGVETTVVERSDTNTSLTYQQKERTSTPQPPDDNSEGSISNNSDSNQAQHTLSKHEDGPKNENCDTQELESRVKTASEHENEPTDGDVINQLGQSDTEQHDALQQSSHGDKLANKDVKPDEEVGPNNQHGDIGYETCTDNMKNQTKNDLGDTTKQIVYIDLNEETDDLNEQLHDKTTFIPSGDNVERQTTIDIASDPRNKNDAVVEQGQMEYELDKTTDNTKRKTAIDVEGGQDTECDAVVEQGQGKGISDKKSDTPMDLCELTLSPTINQSEILAPTTTTTVVGSLPLTPSTDNEPSPSTTTGLDSDYHLNDKVQPLSSLKTTKTDDAPNWIYTKHFSSHHRTFATNDVFAEEFPVFQEEEERPIAPKRKSKLSLSCKKKPKTS